MILKYIMIKLRYERRKVKNKPNFLKNEINFDGFISSNIINGYRNNNEFTCGYDKEGNISVGFQEGSVKKGFPNIFV
jgi:hypothetical protein